MGGKRETYVYFKKNDYYNRKRTEPKINELSEEAQVQKAKRKVDRITEKKEMNDYTTRK